MKWVTREKVKVDRVACPWLIRKFVDPQAQLLFVPADQVMAVAEREKAIPYDVPGVEFGHHGKECSFDAIVKKHHLDRDPALVLLAKIVNGADTDNSLRSLKVFAIWDLRMTWSRTRRNGSFTMLSMPTARR